MRLKSQLLWCVSLIKSEIFTGNYEVFPTVTSAMVLRCFTCVIEKNIFYMECHRQLLDVIERETNVFVWIWFWCFLFFFLAFLWKCELWVKIFFCNVSSLLLYHLSIGLLWTTELLSDTIFPDENYRDIERKIVFYGYIKKKF